MRLIAREATRLLRAELASVFLLDHEKRQLRSVVTLDGEHIRFDAGSGIAGAAALTGKVINVEDVSRDARFNPELDRRTGLRTRNLLVVPLRNHQGEIIGTFQALNKRQGAFDRDDEELLGALAGHVASALETALLIDELRRHEARLVQENATLRREVVACFATRHIVGLSSKLQEVLRLVERVNDSKATVLISGESGTGKELIACAIHYGSPRAAGPFVPVNCAALPDSLVESELFGMESGVATGVDARPGKFETADHGTLFLDEIGDLSLAAQAKILRLLQEGIVERVGSRKGRPIDVRVLAATHRDLDAAMRDGRFREDLFYRLNVIRIRMPALREIPEDIPILANHFLRKHAEEMRKEPKALSPEALESVLRYPWPGNARELENEMKRLVLLSRRNLLQPEELSEPIRRAGAAGGDASQGSPSARSRPLAEGIRAFERSAIEQALHAARNNKTVAARALGLSRQGLLDKMRRYGVGGNRDRTAGRE